jgi:hypothetical protein
MSHAARPKVDTTISADAMVSWNRIPVQAKAEIVEAISYDSRAGMGGPGRQVRIDNRVLTVQEVSSGYRVIYERSATANTILSVLTPREVKLFGIK